MTMISFRIALENPWARRQEQVDFFCHDYKLSTNKNLVACSEQ